MGKFIPNMLLTILLFVSPLAQAENKDSPLPPTSKHGKPSNTITIKKSIHMSNHQPHVADHIRRNMQDHHMAAMRALRKRASLNQKQVRLN